MSHAEHFIHNMSFLLVWEQRDEEREDVHMIIFIPSPRLLVMWAKRAVCTWVNEAVNPLPPYRIVCMLNQLWVWNGLWFICKRLESSVCDCKCTAKWLYFMLLWNTNAQWELLLEPLYLCSDSGGGTGLQFSNLKDKESYFKNRHFVTDTVYCWTCSTYAACPCLHSVFSSTICHTFYINDSLGHKIFSLCL